MDALARYTYSRLVSKASKRHCPIVPEPNHDIFAGALPGVSEINKRDI
jgi:hypothetical protein